MRHFTATLLTAAALGLAATGAAWCWGAIAVDDYRGEDPATAGYGSATQYGSRDAATTAAMDACSADDNSDCKVVLTFKGCGAYASSSGSYGTGTGATQAVAEKRALTACGDGDCIIVVSDCE